MLFSPSKALVPIREQVDSRLVGDAAWRRIDRVASHFPAVWSQFVLESRLSDEPQVDLLLGTVRDDDTLDAVHAYFDQPAHSHNCHNEYVKSGLRNWFEKGETDEYPIFWVESDIAADGSRSGAGVGVDPNHYKVSHAEIYQTCQYVDWCVGGLETFPGVTVSAAQRDTLARVVGALPQHRAVAYVAPLLSRGSYNLRIVVSLFEHEIRPYLKDIGWLGSTAAADRALEFSCSLRNYIGMQLEIDATGVADYLAFENYFGPHGLESEMLARYCDMAGSFFDGLDVGKLESAAAWTGSSEVEFPLDGVLVEMHRSLVLKNVVSEKPIAPKVYLEATYTADF